MKPILKWPGGKRFIAPRISSIVSGLDAPRYFEPFAGGAALFFEMHHPRAYLSDTNAELINFYTVVRDSPLPLIKKLESFENTEAEYYRVRSSRPSSSIGRAVRFYYLMRLSFNGIYRENLEGVFNVPFGHKTHLEPLDREAIVEGSKLLSSASIVCRSFAASVRYARSGDLVYFDPPYTVRDSNTRFIKYNKRLFSWSDQTALATAADDLSRRGCYVIVSNAAHADISDLYPNFARVEITRHSKISAKNHGRNRTTESLFLSPSIPLEHEELLA
jgi:DNA adenine methylase